MYKYFILLLPICPMQFVLLLRNISPLSFFIWKGVNIVKYSYTYYEITIMKFDSFVKKVLSNELKDICRRKKKEREKTVYFNDLSSMELNVLSKEDTHDIFNDKLTVLGFNIYIENELLFEALKSLKEKNCNVIILAYWLGMNDYEIAKKLNIPRRSVSYIRNETKIKIKRFMEDI